MQRTTDENLKSLVRKQLDCQKEVHKWEDLSKVGFIGLVATELPEFFAKESRKHSWRPWAFAASSISVVIGAVMSWRRQKQADKMREDIVEQEYDHHQSAGWGTKIAAEQNSPSVITK